MKKLVFIAILFMGALVSKAQIIPTGFSYQAVAKTLKKIALLLISILAMGLSANATQWTCSSNPARPAMITNASGSIAWSMVYSKAKDGDTIILYGSNVNSYGSANIKKRLTIFGEGWGQAASFAHEATTFDALTFDSISSTTNGNGCLISGIVVTNDITINNIRSLALDLVYTPKGILYQGPTNLASDFHFTRSYFRYINYRGQGANNARYFIENCYMNTSYYKDAGFVSLINSTIKHCFIGGDRNTPFWYCNNMLVSDNIFVNAREPNGGFNNGDYDIIHSNFDNNLIIPNGQNMTLASNNIGTNSSSGNVNSGIGFNDFVQSNYNNDNLLHFDGTIDLNHDFRLTSTSEGSVLGGNRSDDNTDIGPTGGSYPFYLQQGAYPSVPAITDLTVTTPNISVGGQLHFKVSAVNKHRRTN